VLPTYLLHYTSPSLEVPFGIVISFEQIAFVSSGAIFPLFSFLVESSRQYRPLYGKDFSFLEKKFNPVTMEISLRLRTLLQKEQNGAKF